MTRPSFRASADALHDEAVRAAGADDFGDPSYREALGVLLDAYDREAKLHDAGHAATRANLVQLLTTRLRSQAQLANAGVERAAAAIRRPIIVLGLVRTGSTALHHLLAQDPELQVLEYWLAARPRPRPPRATVGERERLSGRRRRDRGDVQLRPRAPEDPSDGAGSRGGMPALPRAELHRRLLRGERDRAVVHGLVRGRAPSSRPTADTAGCSGSSAGPTRGAGCSSIPST